MRQRKRRRGGEGSIHQRPNGSYAAILELSKDQHGNRRRRTVYGRTENEVLKKLNDLRKELTEHGDLPTADMRVEKWLTYWLDEIAAKRVKPSTLKSYRGAVNLYLIPTLGRKPISRLAPAHIREMHRYVIDQGCSTTTAHNAHRILAAALNDAEREGIGHNTAALVRAPAKAPSKRLGLSWVEARDVLAAASTDERTAGRWLAAFLLGARQGELLGLRWDYLDLDIGIVDLAWSLQRVGYAHGCNPPCGQKNVRRCPTKILPIPAGLEFEQLYGNLCLLRPKTRTSQRVLPLPNALWETLRLRRQQYDTEHAGYTVDHGLVWCRPDGQPLDPRDDWQTWHDLLTAANVKRKVTLHEARHSTATWLLEQHIDEKVIRDLLGHSDVLTTRSYQHVSQAVGRDALDAIADRLALPDATSRL